MLQKLPNEFTELRIQFRPHSLRPAVFLFRRSEKAGAQEDKIGQSRAANRRYPSNQERRSYQGACPVSRTLCRPGAALAQVGTLRRRPVLGDGTRGLQRRWQRLGFSSARSGTQQSLSLG